MSARAEDQNSLRFSFCPYDGTRLIIPSGRKQTLHPTCQKCGFVDFGNPKPCVAVLVTDEGRVLLARRRVKPAKGMWDIPGGFIDAQETAEQAVIREMAEETGLHIQNVLYLTSIPDTYGPHGVPSLNLCFTAEVCSGKLKPASDVGQLRWFAPPDIPQRLAFRHQPKLLAVWRTHKDSARDL